MISDTPKPFIHIHIPKCAGTSIELFFIRECFGFESWPIPFELATRHCLPPAGNQHRKLRWFDSKIDISKFFKFTFVRNPWSRAVSQVNYLKWKADIFRYNDVKDNLRILCDSSCHVELHDLGAQQSDYLTNEAGEIEMDFIGRMENLTQDFKSVCNEIGLSGELPHMFHNENARHYTEYYDDDLRDLVAQKYHRDIELFGYEFGD